MFKKLLNLNKLSSILFYTSILTFIIAFNFAHNPPGGWYQQFLPDLNNRPLADITFVDSLVGYGVTGDYTGGDTNYIIKTTNSGDNWFIINCIYKDLKKVKFINPNTGYVIGGRQSLSGYLIKTTNAGLNWIELNTPFGNGFDDIFVLNEDTIWVTSDISFSGGLYRTTDGGASWILQYFSTGNTPKNIYMVNSQIGFFSSSNESFLNRTTNGGFNWAVINGEKGFIQMYFSDSLEGWKTAGDTIRFTSNGGINWTKQTLPSGGQIEVSVITSFYNLNKDTIWGCGGWIRYGINNFRGLLYRTTNKGDNWYYQIPDTSIHIASYEFINFSLNKHGWAYSNYPNYITGIHTNIGGDTTFLAIIKELSTDVLKYYTLFQNYPNPFNPNTKIKYELRIASYVSLVVYDISGKEITILVNQRQNSGIYEIDFDGSKISSGVYFYRLEAEDSKGNIFLETKKMILLR